MEQCKMPRSMRAPRGMESLKSKSTWGSPRRPAVALVPRRLGRSSQRQLPPTPGASEVYLHIYKYMFLLPFLDFSTLDVTYWVPTIEDEDLALRDLPEKLGVHEWTGNQVTHLKGRQLLLSRLLPGMQLKVGRVCQSMFICKSPKHSWKTDLTRKLTLTVQSNSSFKVGLI